MFSPADIKKEFPIYEAHPDLVYLDNAATTQRPHEVIDTISGFYTDGNASTHRGVYGLSNRATRRFEGVRDQIGKFLGAKGGNIAFTKGATESINIVARSYLAPRLKKGDNIVVSIMEHHANLIPWHQLAKQKGAELRIAPLDGNGDLDMNALAGLLDGRTKMLALVHVSNTLGTVNPIQEAISIAHQKDIPALIDAAQSAAYYELDAAVLAYDFLVFSGHKCFGPFGTGVLYAADRFIDEIQPYNLGGGIIREVTEEDTVFGGYPHHLDAGTPNVAGAIGLGAAIGFVEKLDRPAVRRYLTALTLQAREALQAINGVKVLGSPKEVSGIISFVIEGIHPHDIASFLDQDGIAVRAGMHCTQPLLTALQVPATVRASFSVYNTEADVDQLVQSVKGLVDFWG
jgi:cysteine desulfurase/selenocysteine lyase